MLNSISWQSYWACLALLATAYYLVIYLLFFRKQFPLLTIWKSLKPATSSPIVPYYSKDKSEVAAREKEVLQETTLVFPNSPNGNLEHIVYACMDEVAAFFVQSKKTRCDKKELQQSLGKLLQKYPQIKNSEYKDSVINIIRTQCETECSIRFSVSEIEQVWKV